tara:strand:- start:198 stop:905 length:708 start_codon:yes stop_codon:yes gene_type:complete
MFSRLCPPALIYLIFCIIQIGIDIMKGYNNTALIKVWVTFVFTILLNYLCQSGLGIVSWIIVFVPFILMTIIVAMLLMLFGLDPRSGKLRVYKTDKDKPLVNTQVKLQAKKSNDRYGLDKPDEQQIEYDKLNIQNKSQTRIKKDTAYGMYTDFHSTSDGRRKEYVKIIRNILIDMRKSHPAAYFENQANACINKHDGDGDFEKCLQSLVLDTANKLGGRAKRNFLKRVRSRNIIK